LSGKAEGFVFSLIILVRKIRPDGAYFCFALNKAIHGFIKSICNGESKFRPRGNHPCFPLCPTQKAYTITIEPESQEKPFPIL
jgi:hypothetical protein